MADIAVLTVHGNNNYYNGDFAVKYSWPELQVNQLKKCTSINFDLFVYDNGLIPEHRETLKHFNVVKTDLKEGIPIGDKRDYLLEFITSDKIPSYYKYIITLDSDAFPISRNWLNKTIEYLNDYKVVAISRPENNDFFTHPSFCAFTRDAFLKYGFSFKKGELY